jgi:hypothetical protein
VADRETLIGWIWLLDNDFIECLIEVADILFADQCGLEIAPCLRDG